MALENQVAQYEITVTRTGEGVQQTVQDFQNLDRTAASLTGTLGASSASLRQLRETSLLTREGFRGLNEAALLTGGGSPPIRPMPACAIGY
jgi:hypothetical protein